MMLQGIGVFVRAPRHLWRAMLRRHPGKKKKASTCNGSVDEIITSTKEEKKRSKRMPRLMPAHVGRAEAYGALARFRRTLHMAGRQREDKMFPTRASISRETARDGALIVRRRGRGREDRWAGGVSHIKARRYDARTSNLLGSYTQTAKNAFCDASDRLCDGGRDNVFLPLQLMVKPRRSTGCVETEITQR